MNKILIHTIAFSPDGVSTAYLYNDIAMKFKSHGFDVSVLTTTPHYNVIKEDLDKQILKPKLLGLYYESNYNGITVKHIPQRKFRNTYFRLLGFIYWHFWAFFLGLFEKDVNLILSPSPPLTLGLINVILGKLKRAKVIYNVQEIYPDLLIKEGGLKSNVLISLLKRIEKIVYNNSDSVITIDNVFYDTIVNRFRHPVKLKIIPNFVDTTIFKPGVLELQKINDKYFFQNSSLKVMYAGNIGLAQDWDSLIKIAIALKDENIEFFVIGEGVQKQFLISEVQVNCLNKVHLIPYQTRETIPSLISYSDLQFIFMTPKTDGLGFPSKVYTIMACAKPLIICSGHDTPIVNFLRDIKCAYIVEESVNEVKINKVVEFLRSVNKLELVLMGERGYMEIKDNYSKEVVLNKYVKLADSLLR